MNDSNESNKALVHAFINAINSRDWDMLDNIVAEDFERHSFAAGEPRVKCRGDLIQYLRTQESIFPKFEEIILDLVAEDNKVAARQQFKGTQLGEMGPYPASCKDMDIEYLAIYKIENGTISEAWAEWDNYTSMKQLGHMDMIRKTNDRS
jgi:steroid delta-isomerase-like uncharacterized protein